jgi:DNA polymerase-3 subunit chi
VTEVLFYHLDRLPLERVLPDLLERSLERGWRAVVQVATDERLEALDAHLWTYREESFLPHGTKKDGRAAEQPVFLTTGDDNPNAAQVRFLADGTDVEDFAPYQRIVILFHGNETESVEQARAKWKAVKAAGHDATYWQQNDRGRWEKKA